MQGRSESGGGGEWSSRSHPTVLVVGAGVSGCACAAALAACGVPVTVVSAALDTVGQPGYGPVVRGGPGGWARIVDTLAALPPSLREVWLDAGVTPDVGAPFFFVDRRLLSIETKRTLESVPGLRFRQGLVTSLREGVDKVGGAGVPSAENAWSTGRLEVGTAFGETIEADVVVLAVGLSLGNGHRAGSCDLGDGRCLGEALDGGLLDALRALGSEFRETTVGIGSQYGRAEDLRGLGWDTLEQSEESGDRTATGSRGRRRVSGVTPLRVALAGRDVPVLGAGDGERRDKWTLGVTPKERGEPREARVEARTAAAADVGWTESPAWSAGWSAEYPAAPHWTEGLRPKAALVTYGVDGCAQPYFSPDGAALAEMYSEPGTEAPPTNGGGGDGWEGRAGEGRLPMATRLGHTVTSLVVANLGEGGRLAGGSCPTLPVWVAGRAGGADDYLGSLDSGVRVAWDVARAIGDMLPGASETGLGRSERGVAGSETRAGGQRRPRNMGKMVGPSRGGPPQDADCR